MEIQSAVFNFLLEARNDPTIIRPASSVTASIPATAGTKPTNDTWTAVSLISNANVTKSTKSIFTTPAKTKATAKTKKHNCRQKTQH